MAFARVYTSDDGQTRFEDIDLFPPEVDRSAPQATSSINFVRSIDGQFTDWHNAPWPMYDILMSGGQLEVGVSDGTVRRFGPGDVVLFEDVTGQGHTSRTVGGDRLTAIVPIAD